MDPFLIVCVGLFYRRKKARPVKVRGPVKLRGLVREKTARESRVRESRVKENRATVTKGRKKLSPLR